MGDLEAEWQRAGATLSDKLARQEFGLTQEEIVKAIRAGQLQYRKQSMHGNPWLRLLRAEVEALATQSRGRDYVKQLKAKTELARVNSELKRLKRQTAELEQRRAKLLVDAAS